MYSYVQYLLHYGLRQKKSELKNPIEITESYYCVPLQIPNKEGFDADIANVLPDDHGFFV